MITFYTIPASFNSRKVQAVINYLGLQVESKLVDLARGDQRAPEFLSINPNGKVPVLIDGDLVLWESNAICQYLVDVYGNDKLQSGDARQRADVSRWLCWQLDAWNAGIGPLIWEHVAKPFMGLGPTDEPEVAKAIARFHVAATVLDKHLATRKFLVGDRLTIADFAVGAPLMYRNIAKMPLEPYKHILAWSARLDEVEGWKATVPPGIS